MKNEQMDFYIDTLWSVDNIDSFYFRTNSQLMADRTKAVMAIDEALGFLAHLGWDWTHAFDPYRLALAAEGLETRLPLLSALLLTERLLELGVLDGELRLKPELCPAIERYVRGFVALEQQEKIAAPLRSLGMGVEVPADDRLHPIILGACRNDHKYQYILAGLYLDGQVETGKEISYYETLGLYWLRRAASNGNAYALNKLRRRARYKTMDWKMLHEMILEKEAERQGLSKAEKSE